MTEEELVATLKAAHWIYPLANTPLLVFGPKMTKLIKTIRDMLEQDVALRYGFEEWVFPRMVPDEVLAKTGWLTHHRQEAWLVDPKRDQVFDPDAKGLFPLKEKFPWEPLPYVLDPIQCVSLYYALYGKTLEHLPLKAFESIGGWSHRHETAPTALTRGIEFLRLELVWIATEKDAIRIRNEVVGVAAKMLADELNLEIKVAESDSCFKEPPLEKYVLRNLGELQTLWRSGSIDVVTSCFGLDLELASAGRSDLLPRRFDIKMDNSSDPLWSGCMGLGLTRIAAAFLVKAGIDPQSWPNRIRRVFLEGGE